MRLYRSKGRVWTGTQADAKAANDGSKDFEEIEVPTDKPSLMKWLNEFDVRPGEKPPVPVIPTSEEMGLSDEQVEGLMRSSEGAGRIIPTSPPPGSAEDCPACLRSARVAKISVSSMASVSIKADLEDVSDVRSLDEIIRIATARRNELLGPPRFVSPLDHPAPSPARVRVRTPQVQA